VESGHAGLEQKLGMLSPRESADAARILATHRPMAKIVAPALAAMSAARGLYRAYPKAPSERAFKRWSAMADRLLPRQG
jgi:hypothetical protein